MVRVHMCAGLKIGHEFSLDCSSWVVKIALFQSIELEELDDRARLVSPLRSSIKAVVRKNTKTKIEYILCIGVVIFIVFAMYYWELSCLTSVLNDNKLTVSVCFSP